MRTEAIAWRKLERQLADPRLFERLVEQEQEEEGEADFHPMSESEGPTHTPSRKPGPNQWGRAVVANRNYARSLAWQAIRSSIIGLLGFSKTFPNDDVFAAAVARWQKAQGGLVVDGIIGPKTLTRLYVALRSAPVTPPAAESSAVSLHKVSAEPGEIRRFQRELGQEAEGSEAFSTDPIPGISDGHTSLTRQIAAEIGLKTDEVTALVVGSAKPDRDYPVNDPRSLDECEQRRHALRGRLCQEVGAALQDVRGHLTKLYKKALATSGTPQFGLIGEALHLIQDSYSPAHTEREQFFGLTRPGAIVYIRVWHPTSPGYPTEHGWPADLRDRLHLQSSSGKAASTATRDFLQMVVGHIAKPGAPENEAQFAAFMNRHLVLSSTNQTVAALTRWAKRVDDKDIRSASYLRCLAPDRPKVCP